MKRLLAAGVMALVLGGIGATSAHAVENGQFCSPAAATATDPKGRALVCDNEDAQGHFHWTLAAEVATTIATTAATVPPTSTTVIAAVQSNTQTPTTVSTMPRTGAREDREALLGLGVLLAGIAAAWWARPRLAALFTGPRVIEQERIDRASKLLGWSDPWDEHLARKQWDRH